MMKFHELFGMIIHPNEWAQFLPEWENVGKLSQSALFRWTSGEHAVIDDPKSVGYVTQSLKNKANSKGIGKTLRLQENIFSTWNACRRVQHRNYLNCAYLWLLGIPGSGAVNTGPLGGKHPGIPIALCESNSLVFGGWARHVMSDSTWLKRPKFSEKIHAKSQSHLEGLIAYQKWKHWLQTTCNSIHYTWNIPFHVIPFPFHVIVSQKYMGICGSSPDSSGTFSPVPLAKAQGDFSEPDLEMCAVWSLQFWDNATI